MWGIAISILSKGREDADSYSTLILFIYSAIATGLYGKTLGKHIFRLKVVTKEGLKPEMKKAFLRDVLGKIISLIPLSLGFFWAFFDKNTQAWHDKIAKTYVVSYAPVSKARRTLAYVLVILIPALALIGLIAVIVLVAVNPTGQIEKTRKIIEEKEQLQIERNNSIQYN